MTDAEIRIGDVVIDLAQGRPMQVVDAYDWDAAEWSDRNDYDLTENYGNARLGAEPSDAVFECVYCSSLKSEPSNSYAFPESRLARVETEAGYDRFRVQERIRVQAFADLLAEAADHEIYEDLQDVIAQVAGTPKMADARDLAETRPVLDDGDTEGENDG